jgi:hypothetical protein
MQPIPLLYEPSVLRPQFIARSRKEVSTKDVINARNLELIQNGGKYGIWDRPDISGQRPFMDMNPSVSRNDNRMLNGQLRYIPNQNQYNQYFDKYDIQNDPINYARELQSAVYEDKGDRGYLESQAIMNRQFNNNFVNSQQLENMTKLRLDARDKLMPIINDTNVSYLDKR